MDDRHEWIHFKYKNWDKNGWKRISEINFCNLRDDGQYDDWTEKQANWEFAGKVRSSHETDENRNFLWNMGGIIVFYFKREKNSCNCGEYIPFDLIRGRERDRKSKFYVVWRRRKKYFDYQRMSFFLWTSGIWSTGLGWGLWKSAQSAVIANLLCKWKRTGIAV